jgi:lantibiotic modifying enzyme
LNENKKEVQLLRSEFITLEHKNKETTNEILKELLEDIVNVEKDFRKLVQMDNNEIVFLKQQIVSLNQEKTKIQQNSIILGTRIANVENEVGFE